MPEQLNLVVVDEPLTLMDLCKYFSSRLKMSCVCVCVFLMDFYGMTNWNQHQKN